jgi:predicted phage-related endonuclease
MIERIAIDENYDWLGARRHYVNASEVPIVMGLSSYASAAELYCEKKGIRPPKLDNAAMRRGRWGEPAVFQALADERPEWKIARAKIHVIDHANRMACTPDGFAIAPGRDGIGIVQAKVVARSMFQDRWLIPEAEGDLFGPVEIPAQYRLQTLTERMLNARECTWAALVVLISGEFDWTLRIFDIEPNAALEDMIVQRVRAFFTEYLDPGIMPPFEPAVDSRLIKQLYPDADGTEIDLTTDNRALVAVEELTENQKACRRVERNIELLKAELTGKLRGATYGRLADGRRLCWRVQTRRAYPVEAKTFRVLRVLKKEPWK